MGRRPPGLGSDHERQRRNTPLPNGDPCPRCDEPMWPGQPLDFGHARDRVLGGTDGPKRWEHAKCNRSAGAKLGNELRKARRQHVDPPPSRNW